MATLSDVATRAGVSISAASRVLSGDPAGRVSAATRERITAAAKELDYRPNFAGRALKMARTNVLALIVPDLTNALFTELTRGVEDAAIELDYVVLLGRAEDMQPGGEMIARLIGEGRVDGVLVQLGETVAAEHVATLAEAKVPVVLIQSALPGRLSSVELEDQRGADAATQHLIDLGHRRIALLNGRPDVSTARRRGAGFDAAMTRAGLEVDPELRSDLGYEPVSGREALRAVMGVNPPPTGVVVANVNAAIGALHEARTLGLRVPEDVSIVGIHDAWTAENTWPPLTTVRMPLYELGRAAVERLVARMRSDERETVMVTEPAPELVIRESTAPPR
ncbi:LacI family DNA-binding transcriptional regulator [Microbacteriaceae bacterium VKM Ac-2855]|nr:LacI family DNA-binding transcriptional regulator [Microbacteriaceae bacterium VKM Ac-2855]